jgi:hypothetical protein
MLRSSLFFLLIFFSGYIYADDIEVCRKMAANIASGLPAQINKYMRVDSAICVKLSGERVIFVSSLTVDNTLSWDSRAWRNLQQDSVKDACEDPEISAIFKYASALRQEWRYKNGKHIGTVTVWREDCRR